MKPPTFQRFPAKRAKKLKQTWVQNAKIKSKWKAEKARMGLNKQVSEQAEDAESWHGIQSSDEDEDSQKEPVADKPSGSHPNGPSLREMTRKAYAKSSLHTYKSGQNMRGRDAATGRGQPNMKLRMGALLKKIERDFKQ